MARLGMVMGLAGLWLASGPRAAWSHAADEAAPPPGAVVIAPRAEARIGQTEIVSVFTRDIYAIFLTQYATDMPITGATIVASTDLQDAKLTETDPGVYSTKELLMSPGQNDMTIKLTQSGVTHSISLPLMMPAEAPPPAAAQPVITTASPMTIGGAIIAVYALLSAAFLVARRRPSRAVTASTRVETREA